MPKEYSININDFTGIHRAMAEKANVNGGKTLKGSEISIFNEIESTYNVKDDTFIFEQEFYNQKGDKVSPLSKQTEKAVSTRVYKIPSTEDLEKDMKNAFALQQAKQFEKENKKNNDKIIIVKEKGKELFRYRKSAIEDYIINDAVDSNGNKIKHFAKINDIRNKPYLMRTKAECQLLVEFDNLIDCVISTGRDYKVDPNLIIAIIQKEVGFAGKSDDIVGINGKGYMQITSIPVQDMLGAYKNIHGKIIYGDTLKTEQFGVEFVKLFKSRGFNVNCSKSDKEKLKSDIMDYLVKNEDVDFNIRLGTLILRYKLKQAKGDVQLAAQNYNGNNKNNIKYNYGIAVNDFYNKLVKKTNHKRRITQ